MICKSAFVRAKAPGADPLTATHCGELLWWDGTPLEQDSTRGSNRVGKAGSPPPPAGGTAADAPAETQPAEQPRPGKASDAVVPEMEIEPDDRNADGGGEAYRGTGCHWGSALSPAS